jgi:hypothetical protein
MSLTYRVVITDEDNFNILKGKAWAVLGHNSDYLYQSMTDEIIRMMDEVRNTPNGKVLTDEEYSALKGALYPVLRVIGPILVDDSNYYDGIDYDAYYAANGQNYYKPDDEMGREGGDLSGRSYGYDDGFAGSPRNEYGYDLYDEYGPVHDEAYKKAFTAAYLEAYELGKRHSEDMTEKGRYDGAMHAYYTGHYDASYGDEPVPYDEFFYQVDWMTDEYIDAYNAAYEEEYVNHPTHSF